MRCWARPTSSSPGKGSSTPRPCRARDPPKWPAAPESTACRSARSPGRSPWTASSWRRPASSRRGISPPVPAPPAERSRRGRSCWPRWVATSDSGRSRWPGTTPRRGADPASRGARHAHRAPRAQRPAVDSRLVASIDFSAQIPPLRSTLASSAQVTDVEALDARIADLEKQASAQDLWDDVENAQKVSAALSHAQSERRRISELASRIEDLEVMVELAAEEDDADTLAEAEEELTSNNKTPDQLEVRTLLSGEYDERSAVITIRAGAGGIDAADFAEMLMRMYLRWAERHGYPTKVMDTS